MTRRQLNPSPAERFREIKGAIEAHHALLALPAYQLAEDYAVMHYARVVASQQVKLVNPNESPRNPQQDAMIAGVKVLAVQEFLDEFRALAEPPPEPVTAPKIHTLNHTR